MDGAIPNVPDAKADRLRRRARARGLPDHRDPGARRLALGVRLGHRPRRGGRRASSARRRCRASSATTTSPTATTATGSRTPSSRSRAIDRVIGDERTSARCVPGSACSWSSSASPGPTACAASASRSASSPRIALGNRQYAGELWRDELVRLCETAPVLIGSAGPWTRARPARSSRPGTSATSSTPRARSSSSGSCSASWRASRHCRPGSRAATLCSTVRLRVPFSTPPTRSTRRGASTRRTRWSALRSANAITDLRDAGIPLDGTLREWQYDERGGERVPIHGGPGTLGVFNAIQSTWNPRQGYSNVPHGSSFIAAMGFSEKGCPGAFAHLRHLRPVREPGFSARGRLHARVLEEAVERGPVLPPRRGSRRRSASSGSRAADQRTSREARSPSR